MSRIDHIGIVVDDLEQARRFLGGVLGLEMISEGQSPHTTARYAFFQWGEVQIEVLEIADPEERRQRLGGDRPARIEHIGVAVDDLGAAVAALRAQGVRTTTAEPFAVNDWRYYFTDPGSTGGVVYQLLSRTG